VLSRNPLLAHAEMQIEFVEKSLLVH
jgi:hypothetical protein